MWPAREREEEKDEGRDRSSRSSCAIRAARGYQTTMHLPTLVIVACAAGGIFVGAHFVGHAVDGPARQLDTVLSEPAQAAGVTAESNLQMAIAAAASYRAEHGSYAGMTTSDLRSYDRGLASGVAVKAA